MPSRRCLWAAMAVVRAAPRTCRPPPRPPRRRPAVRPRVASPGGGRVSAPPRATLRGPQLRLEAGEAAQSPAVVLPLALAPAGRQLEAAQQAPAVLVVAALRVVLAAPAGTCRRCAGQGQGCQGQGRLGLGIQTMQRYSKHPPRLRSTRGMARSSKRWAMSILSRPLVTTCLSWGAPALASVFHSPRSERPWATA